MYFIPSYLLSPDMFFAYKTNRRYCTERVWKAIGKDHQKSQGRKMWGIWNKFSQISHIDWMLELLGFLIGGWGPMCLLISWMGEQNPSFLRNMQHHWAWLNLCLSKSLRSRNPPNSLPKPKTTKMCHLQSTALCPSPGSLLVISSMIGLT